MIKIQYNPSDRFTVWQKIRLPDNTYSPEKTIAKHLKFPDAHKLTLSLKGIVGYYKEFTNE